MKRIAIAELEGAALDWAAGKAAGKEISLTMAFFSGCHGGMVPWDDAARKPWVPTRNWRQCGPLIERYRIGIEQSGSDIFAYLPGRGLEGEFGQTPLIAACRAIAAAHNPSGYVEVPDELVEGE